MTNCSAHLYAKKKAWAEQSQALQADHYRVTLKDRSLVGGVDRSHNIGKGKGPAGDEKFFPAAEIDDMLPRLAGYNCRGFDVYLTPISSVDHYILVDDVREANVQTMLDDGYTPCLIQQSSQDNFQVILRVRRNNGMRHEAEQSLANKVLVGINEEFGDPKISGVIRPFRMAGYSNKKPGKGNVITKVTFSDPVAFCAITQARFDSLCLPLTEAGGKPVGSSRPVRQRCSGSSANGNHTYDGIAKFISAADRSSVDWGVARALADFGRTEDEIAEVIFSGGHVDQRGKGNDAYPYCLRTARKAIAVSRCRVGGGLPVTSGVQGEEK